VLADVVRIGKEIGGIELWCFGSATRGTGANDLDLLAIYEERDGVVRLRSELEQIQDPTSPKFDLICMRPSEEQFYAFISSTGAVRIL
jgi:predicted nucleotidyltransferase